MKNLFLAALLAAAFGATAQSVGVNTSAPAATLQVVGAPTATNVADGVMVPSLTGNQLKAKDAAYDAAQTGAMVYITAAASPTTVKTANVTAAGFYYFDGAVWQRTGRSIQPGQLLNTVFVDDPPLLLPGNFSSGTFTDLISYSYTPVYNNSKIMVQYHNNSYTIGGSVGGLQSDGDGFQSQLLMPYSPTINTQRATVQNNAGTSFRTGALFPIAGVANNNGTTPIAIKVQVRKGWGDDYINFEGTNGTLIIQEIAN
ncbi:MAG: hypothetical protein JNL51_05585 [Chitinophagaceae bacterium]|nr:hypothetical protein [Chitinophagaceae bacterium]